MKILSNLVVLVISLGSLAGALEVRFLADRKPEDVETMTILEEDQVRAELEIPVSKLSEVAKVTEREFKILVEETGKPLAEVKLPSGGREFVVLLSATDDGFAPTVLPSKNSKFRGGDLFCHNGSDKKIVGSIGGVEIALEPGKSQAVRPKVKRSDSVYEVSFSIMEDGEEHLLTKSSWPVEKTLRSYVLFFFDPEKERVTFRSLDEFVGD